MSVFLFGKINSQRTSKPRTKYDDIALMRVHTKRQHTHKNKMKIMAKSQCYELNNLIEPSQTSAIFWFFCCDRHICLHAMPDILDELHANCFLIHLSVRKTPTIPFPSYTIHGGRENKS